MQPQMMGGVDLYFHFLCRYPHPDQCMLWALMEPIGRRPWLSSGLPPVFFAGGLLPLPRSPSIAKAD